MTKTFVIHRHTGFGEDHYDLMIPEGDMLATWRLDRSPETLEAGQSQPAVRIADHREAFLDYEGPISKNRGRVQRCDKGPCDVLSRHNDRWHVRFEGRMLCGVYDLVRADDGWRLVCVSS